MNLYDVFCRTAKRQPGHLAIVGPDRNSTYSYYQLHDAMEAVSEQLKSAGVRSGECVGLHYPSGREYIILNYALWRCGACVVPIPVELVPEEKQRICREIGLTAVVSRVDGIKAIEPYLQGQGTEILEDAVFTETKRSRTNPPGFGDLNAAFLRFTSGTTGTSKGVVLSHETIYDRIHAANDVLHIGPSDRVIWLLSMSYHFAVSIVAYLSFGATIVLCKSHFGAAIIQMVNEYQGTVIYGSPMHYELMAHDTSALMLPSLRLAISTTIALRSETLDAFNNRFHIPLTQAFGIIEIGLPCINWEKPMEKRGSVGKVLPAYDIRMDDIGLGNKLSAIKFRGKGLFDAYYDPWQPREQVMADGWFTTGDLGELDEEGYLFIRGRNKDIINVAGMKFFPQEVEQILDSHPSVMESSTYAHAHELFGEIPYANVVLKPGLPPPTEAELKEYCGRHLAAFKVPEKILFVKTLTRTASGKLIRQESKLD